MTSLLVGFGIGIGIVVGVVVCFAAEDFWWDWRGKRRPADRP